MEGKNKKALNINLDELCEAMEDSSYEHEYYLDLKTGEILFISDYMDDEETRELKGRVEEDSERYKRIPKAESHEGYQDMVDFIATVDNERLAELLEVAWDTCRRLLMPKNTMPGYWEHDRFGVHY